MRLVVMKFGGTSVEDATAIDRTAEIVAGASRMGCSHRGRERDGEGDGPVAAPRQPQPDAATGSARSPSASRLRGRHQRHCLANCSDWRAAAPISDIRSTKFDALDELLRGIAAVGELTPRITDLRVSYGERLRAAWSQPPSAAWHQGSHVDARDLIVTDAHYRKSRPAGRADREALPNMCCHWSQAGRSPVMGGFIGVNGGGRHDHAGTRRHRTSPLPWSAAGCTPERSRYGRTSTAS